MCVMLFWSWVLFDFFGAFSRTQPNTKKENIFTESILHQKIFYNETIGVKISCPFPISLLNILILITVAFVIVTIGKMDGWENE